jgi:hypothetical protein
LGCRVYWPEEGKEIQASRQNSSQAPMPALGFCLRAHHARWRWYKLHVQHLELPSSSPIWLMPLSQMLGIKAHKSK